MHTARTHTWYSHPQVPGVVQDPQSGSQHGDKHTQVTITDKLLTTIATQSHTKISPTQADYACAEFSLVLVDRFPEALVGSGGH